MRINSKYQKEIVRNIKVILSYLAVSSDEEIDAQADFLMGLIRLINDDNLYLAIHNCQPKVFTTLHIPDPLSSGFEPSLKFTDPKRYLSYMEKVETDQKETIQGILERNRLEGTAFEKVVRDMIIANKLNIRKPAKLSRSEYRSKVKLIVGNPKNKSENSVFLQIFRDTSERSIRDFLKENRKVLKGFTTKTDNYPYRHKFENIRETMIAYLSRVIDKDYNEIISLLESSSKNECKYDKEYVKVAVMKFKKMLN